MNIKQNILSVLTQAKEFKDWPKSNRNKKANFVISSLSGYYEFENAIQANALINDFYQNTLNKNKWYKKAIFKNRLCVMQKFSDFHNDGANKFNNISDINANAIKTILIHTGRICGWNQRYRYSSFDNTGTGCWSFTFSNIIFEIKFSVDKITIKIVPLYKSSQFKNTYDDKRRILDSQIDKIKADISYWFKYIQFLQIGNWENNSLMCDVKNLAPLKNDNSNCQSLFNVKINLYAAQLEALQIEKDEFLKNIQVKEDEIKNNLFHLEAAKKLLEL